MKLCHFLFLPSGFPRKNANGNAFEIHSLEYNRNSLPFFDVQKIPHHCAVWSYAIHFWKIPLFLTHICCPTTCVGQSPSTNFNCSTRAMCSCYVINLSPTYGSTIYSNVSPRPVILRACILHRLDNGSVDGNHAKWGIQNIQEKVVLDKLVPWQQGCEIRSSY